MTAEKCFFKLIAFESFDLLSGRRVELRLAYGILRGVLVAYTTDRCPNETSRKPLTIPIDFYSNLFAPQRHSIP